MERLSKLKKNMVSDQITIFLIKNSKNIRYLTGFTGDESVLIVSQERTWLITDGRYVEQAKKEVQPDINIIKWQQGIFEEISQLVNASAVERLFFEGDQLNYLEYVTLKHLISAEIKPIQGYIERLRMIKDEHELTLIKHAVQIIDQTFLHILNDIRPGVSERQIANEMEYFMKKQGAEGVAFETIVASGVRSAYPHGEASDKLIELGDLVTLDFGALYQGYASDMTRTIAVGQVEDSLEEVYQLVLQAEMNGLKTIKAGMSSRELDTVIRDPIVAKGMNQYFNHGAGHSIGLDIHEIPYISHNSDAQFEVNMVQTIEPGIYLPNIGGIRIEDDILVQDGLGSVLTKSPKKDLIKLPCYR